MELIGERGFEGLVGALVRSMNEAMRMERERYLGRAPYQRGEARRGHANGFGPKTVKSRLGEVRLAVPRVREGGFYSKVQEKGLRSERALKLALPKIYATGVSTRKVARISGTLCALEVSSTEESRCEARLDGELSAWRERPLGEFRYVCSMSVTRRCAMAAGSSTMRC